MHNRQRASPVPLGPVVHRLLREDAAMKSVEDPIPEPSNPVGLDGIEFIEYATSHPQAFGAVLMQMGFAAVALQRSREVMLYRQGSMNLIVNSHGATSAEPVVSA